MLTLDGPPIVEAQYWSLVLTDHLNMGSAIMKVETSLSTGELSDPQGQMIDLQLNAEWTGLPATRESLARPTITRKDRCGGLLGSSMCRLYSTMSSFEDSSRHIIDLTNVVVLDGILFVRHHTKQQLRK